MDNFYKIPPITHTKPGLHNCNFFTPSRFPNWPSPSFEPFIEFDDTQMGLRGENHVCYRKLMMFLMVLVGKPRWFLQSPVYFMANTTPTSLFHHFFALTFQKQPGALHTICFHSFTVRFAMNVILHLGGRCVSPWEVGKGNSHGRFIGRHVFFKYSSRFGFLPWHVQMSFFWFGLTLVNIQKKPLFDGNSGP